MARVKDFFFDEIEDQAMRVNYPIEYDGIHKDCERAVYDLGMQLEHVKTFPPTLVREHKDDIIKTLLDHCDYLRSLS